MGNNSTSNNMVSSWPIVIVMALLVVVSAVFIVLFITLSDVGTGAIREDQLTETSYMDRVDPLLENADPVRALEVIYGEEFNCASCHLNDAGLGPHYDQLATAASERRPPLQAPAYIYESILFPTAFEVEGAWRANMPINFRDRLSDEQLGDVIAWLLLPAEERPTLDSP